MNKGLPMIIKYLAMLLSLLTNPQHAMQRPMSTDPLAQQSALAGNNPVASSSQANQEMLMRQLHEAAARLDVKRIRELLEQKGFVTEAEERAIGLTASEAANSSIIRKLVNGDMGLIYEKTAYSSRILTVIAGASGIMALSQVIDAKYFFGVPLSKLPLPEKITFWLGIAIFIPSASAALGSWYINWYASYINKKFRAIDDALSSKLRYSYN